MRAVWTHHRTDPRATGSARLAALWLSATPRARAAQHAGDEPSGGVHRQDLGGPPWGTHRTRLPGRAAPPSLCNAAACAPSHVHPAALQHVALLSHLSLVHIPIPSAPCRRRRAGGHLTLSSRLMCSATPGSQRSLDPPRRPRAYAKWRRRESHRVAGVEWDLLATT